MKKCEYCLGATWIEPDAHNRIVSRYTGRSSREQGASILLNADTETGTYTYIYIPNPICSPDDIEKVIREHGWNYLLPINMKKYNAKLVYEKSNRKLVQKKTKYINKITKVPAVILENMINNIKKIYRQYIYSEKILSKQILKTLTLELEEALEKHKHSHSTQIPYLKYKVFNDFRRLEYAQMALEDIADEVNDAVQNLLDECHETYQQKKQRFDELKLLVTTDERYIYWKEMRCRKILECSEYEPCYYSAGVEIDCTICRVHCGRDILIAGWSNSDRNRKMSKCDGATKVFEVVVTYKPNIRYWKKYVFPKMTIESDLSTKIFKELCDTREFRTHLEDWFFKKLEIMLKNQTELDGRVLL